MLVDGRSYLPGAVIQADVCVIGTGPAGITVTEQLRGSGLRTVMLESGGLRHEDAADSLADAADGMTFGTVHRLGSARQLGGNANAWKVRTGEGQWRGVRLAPMPAEELGARPGVGLPGWPVDPAELASYLRRAQDVFGLPSTGYDAESWRRPGREPLDLTGTSLRSMVFQFGAAGTFIEQDLPELRRAPEVTIVEHATAVELRTDETGGQVVAVRARTAPDRDLTVRASFVVVAGGAIPSTQLLLASDAVHQGGLGNASGHLGRYFMDHLLLDGGTLVPSARGAFSRMAFYDLRRVDDTPVMGHLQLTGEALATLPVLSLSTLLYPRAEEDGYRQHRSPREDRAIRGALAAREALLRRRPPGSHDLRDAVLGADAVVRRLVSSSVHPVPSLGRGGWSELNHPDARFSHYAVIHQVEQAPHRSNTITLSDERDAMGMRRVAVSWRWHEEDVTATLRAQRLVADGLRTAGVGELTPRLVDGAPAVLHSSSSHFMGTTRMSTHPSAGVVDPECRVHGVANLWVASSSVFPTGGFANPTLTAVTLAVRIADRIRAEARARYVPAAGWAHHEPAA